MFTSALVFVLLITCIFAKEQAECTVEENGKYYDLSALKSTTDYDIKIPNSDRLFHLNVCGPVHSEVWKIENPKEAGAVYRDGESDSDISIGKFNTTLVIKDSNPLLLLTDGSPCGKESPQRASTAIRFICDDSEFGKGQPHLIAQLPPDDETSCAFFFEWRTHLACPTAKPGSGVIAILAAIVLILLISYIVIGVLYRRFVLGYEGFDQFPRLSLIPLSAIPHYFSEFLDWLGDLRDHFRGGSRDIWPRSSGFRRRNDGFAPLAREEEEAMFRDGPDGPDTRFSIEDDDVTGPTEISNDIPPPVPDKTGAGMDSSGVIRL